MSVVAKPGLIAHKVHAVIGNDQNQRLLRKPCQNLANGIVYGPDVRLFLRGARPVRMTSIVTTVEVNQQQIGHSGVQDRKCIRQDVVAVRAAIAVTITRERKLGVAIERQRITLNSNASSPARLTTVNIVSTSAADTAIDHRVDVRRGAREQ